jgi:4-hydroxybenzoate polyprenyltransferase
VNPYRTATLVMAVITVGLGIALVAATLAQGSGGLGILLGLLFIAAGLGRLYLARGGRR